VFDRGGEATLSPSIRRWLIRLTVGPLLCVVVHLVVFKHVPVPLTPLMLIRGAQGEGLDHDWVPLSQMSPHLARAVIASEDNRFCEHSGIDWVAFGDVFEEARAGGRLRGASTISMQTVKNLYLWPGRSYVRKVLEAGLVFGLESAWDKERIIEVYLNIAEMGPGVYGVEAASQHHFGRSALDLSFVQAASLAAILPSPRTRDPTHRNRAMGSRVGRIRRSVHALGPRLDCVPAAKGPVQLERRPPPALAGKPEAEPESESGSPPEPEPESKATDNFPEHFTPRKKRRRRSRSKRGRRNQGL
jgi:monofunctional biosynthetic peptidoglycan transglycosylase